MRPTAALFALALAPLAQAQFPTGTISFERRASSVKSVLGELSVQTHIQIEAVPEINNEIVLVSVTNAPIDTVLRGLAKTVEGEWKLQGSVLRLVVDKETRRKNERKELQKKALAIAEAIKERAKKSDSTPGLTADGLITRLLQGIDPTVLADLGPNGRLVFSTDPNRLQLSFGAGATEQIDAFIKNHNANLPSAAEGIDKALSNLDQKQADAIKALTQNETKVIGQVRKGLLVVTKMSLGIMDMTQIQLKLYDSSGKTAFTGQSILSLKGDEMSQLISAATTKKKPETNAKSTPIEYSDDSKELDNSTKGMIMGNYGLHFSPELQVKLMNPTKSDPLSFSASDELLSYARSRGKSIIACVPDSAGGMSYASLTGGNMTVETVDRDLHAGKKMQILDESSIILIEPAHPALERSLRVDRVALETLLKRSQGKMIPSLDDMADYAKSSPDPSLGGVGQTYITLFVPGGSQQGLGGPTNWNMLRFYADLSPDSRNSLRQGAKLSLGSLSSIQRNCLESIVYSSNSGLSVARETKQEPQPFYMQIMGASTNIDYRDEPTEALPNGIPNDGFLDLAVSQEPFGFPVASNGNHNIGAMAVLDADELAIFKMLKEDKNFSQFASFMPKFGQMKVGSRELLNFTFHFSQDISSKQVLKDHHLPDNAQIYSENDLPADFQKLIGVKLDEFKKSPLGALSSLAALGGKGIRP